MAQRDCHIKKWGNRTSGKGKIFLKVKGRRESMLRLPKGKQVRRPAGLSPYGREHGDKVGRWLILPVYYINKKHLVYSPFSRNFNFKLKATEKQ